jgi:cystathionine beta-lyase
MKGEAMNFDRVIDRRKSKSLKWNREVLINKFGSDQVLPLWVADMDFEVAEPIRQAMLDEVNTNIYGYSVREKTYDQAVIDWYKRRFQCPLEPEWLVYTPGIVPAIGFALDAYLKAGDQVVIQEPVYFPFKEMVLSRQMVVLNNALIEEDQTYRVDFEDFEKKVSHPKTKMFILCSPHNPIGKVWDPETLKRLGDLCVKHDVLIFADEIHHDLVYKKHHILLTLDPVYKDYVITATAPSKTFNLAGLQTSHIIIPNDHLREKFQKVLQKLRLIHQNPIAMAGVEAAYQEGEAWLEALLLYLQENIQIIDDFIKEKLPLARFNKPDGTYLAWLDLRAYEKNPDKLMAKLVEEGHIALNNGGMFGSAGQGFVRLNFACPKSVLKQALDALYKGIGR